MAAGLNALPLLALDVGNIIGLVILVISVLGWIVNAVKGLDPNGNPLPNRPRAPKPPKRDLRSELEVFLEELQKPAAAQRPPAESAQEFRPVEVRTEPPARPRQDKPRPKKNTQAQNQNKGGRNRPVDAEQAARQTMVDKMSRSRPSDVGQQRSGQTVRQHLQAHMAPNPVAAEVQQFFSRPVTSTLGHRIEQAVEKDLAGGTVAPVSQVTTATAPLHPIMLLMNNTGGARQALVLNEILQRPRPGRFTRITRR